MNPTVAFNKNVNDCACHNLLWNSVIFRPRGNKAKPERTKEEEEKDGRTSN